MAELWVPQIGHDSSQILFSYHTVSLRNEIMHTDPWCWCPSGQWSSSTCEETCGACWGGAAERRSSAPQVKALGAYRLSGALLGPYGLRVNGKDKIIRGWSISATKKRFFYVVCAFWNKNTVSVQNNVIIINENEWIYKN